ncbi:MAG: hypothetical protein ACXWQE_04640 [Bdellovibrionales bacterium]
MRSLWMYILFVYILLVLSAPSVFARPWFCPDLEGTYACSDGRVGYNIRVQHKDVGWHLHYIFESPAEGTLEFTADNATRPFENAVGTGTISASCQNDRLLVLFLLKDRQGLDLHVQDTIYLDEAQDALIHIRLSLPTSQVSMSQNVACKRVPFAAVGPNSSFRR